MMHSIHRDAHVAKICVLNWLYNVKFILRIEILTPGFTNLVQHGYTYQRVNINISFKILARAINSHKAGEPFKFKQNGPANAFQILTVVPLKTICKSILKQMAYNDHSYLEEKKCLVLSISQNSKVDNLLRLWCFTSHHNYPAKPHSHSQAPFTEQRTAITKYRDFFGCSEGWIATHTLRMMQK